MKVLVLDVTQEILHILSSLQTDLDEYMNRFNTERTHQGKRCKGRTPMTTLLDGLELCKEKNLAEKLAA